MPSLLEACLGTLSGLLAHVGKLTETYPHVSLSLCSEDLAGPLHQRGVGSACCHCLRAFSPGLLRFLREYGFQLQLRELSGRKMRGCPNGKNLLHIGAWLIYSVLLVSGVQQSHSVTYTYVHSFPDSFPI